MALLVQLASPFDPVASRRFWGQGIQQDAQSNKDLHRQEKPKPARPIPVVEIHRAPPKQDAVNSPQFVKAKVNTPDLPAGVESASPYGRLFALVLSLLFFVFGIGGLHRFYVGRIGSGFLWLITGGLLGIGQLVDVVMIAVGQFRDADGKRVLAFPKDMPSQILKPVNEYSAVLRDSWTDSHIGFKLGNLFLNLVGAILLVACLVIGAVVAVGLPQAFADGVFGQQVAIEIAEETISDWYIIVNNVLAFVLVIVGTVAAGCLLFARRLTTVTHMARVPLAVVGLVAAVTSLGAATQFGRKWVMIGDDVANEMIGSAISRLFENEFWPALVIACIAFVTSIFILAWPARRVETYVQTSPAVNSEESQSKQTQETQTV